MYMRWWSFKFRVILAILGVETVVIVFAERKEAGCSMFERDAKLLPD